MPDTKRPLANQTLSVRAARTLSDPTRTAPQMLAVTPRWLLHLLPWVNVEGGTYQVNRRRLIIKQGNRIVSGIDGDHAQLDPQSLRELPFLRDADDALLAAIAGLLFEERHNANEVLYREGDAGSKFYIVVRGKVEVSTTDAHGEPLRLALYGDGDYFGETALRRDWRHTTTAQTLTPTVFLTLERARLTALLAGAPELQAAHAELVRQAEAGLVKPNAFTADDAGGDEHPAAQESRMTVPAASPLARAFEEALRKLTPAIERALRDLPSAELKVLRLRFGIGAQRLSQRATARRLAISVGTVRRLERRALRDLRALSFPGDVPRCRTRPRGVVPPRRPVGSATQAAHVAGEPAQLAGC